MSFELPPHRWRHIQGTGPDGQDRYPGVEWWVCEACLKTTEMGRSLDQPPEPGTCWGKKPLTEEHRRLADLAMRIITTPLRKVDRP